MFLCHKLKPDTDSLTNCSVRNRCPVLFLSYSSLEAFRVQISCSHENLNSESFEGSAILRAKRSCKAAESIEDAIHDNRMFAERAFYCIANGAGELAHDYKKQRRRLMKLQILVSSLNQEG